MKVPIVLLSAFFMTCFCTNNPANLCNTCTAKQLEATFNLSSSASPYISYNNTVGRIRTFENGCNLAYVYCQVNPSIPDSNYSVVYLTFNHGTVFGVNVFNDFYTWGTYVSAPNQNKGKAVGVGVWCNENGRWWAGAPIFEASCNINGQLLGNYYGVNG